MLNSDYIEAGRVCNTYGLNGKLKVEVWLDSVEFLAGFPRVFIQGRAYLMKSCRQQKDFAIISLDGVDNIDAAKNLKGKALYISREDAHLEPGEFFICDIIGSKVLDDNSNEIGTLIEALETPASIVYIVKGESEHLIPAVPEFIMSTDIVNKTVRVKLIEGM